MNRNILTILLLILITMSWTSGCVKQPKSPNVMLLPNLPYPIAKEPALITSAGQGPEGLIVAKMSDKLKINNKYRYKADPSDLQNMGALIVVEGISGQGLEAAFTTLEEDEVRITSLLKEAIYINVPIVVVFPGGKVRRTKHDDKLAEELVASADYVIALQEANKDYFYSKLAKKYNKKLTIKQSIHDIPIPLNSVFR